jgi:alkylation response protein AidB-like acyl-CoA dehydrogenase
MASDDTQSLWSVASARAPRSLRLILDEEQQMLAKTARGFVSEKSPVSRMRRLRDSGDATGFSRELWSEMGELGWLGLELPEAHGGLGLGFFDLCVVLEEAGRKLMPEPFVSTLLLGAGALRLGGTEAQKAAHLPAIAEGARIVTLAFEEAGRRFDGAHAATVARRVAGGYELRGAKAQVLDGHVADVLIGTATVTADGGEGGLGLFLVDPKANGVRITRQSRVDSRNVASVTLDAVRVTADAALGEPGRAEGLLSDVLDRAAIGLSAEMLGGAEQAFADTVGYLKERVQFGVPIGSFQALQHRAARLFIEHELCRSAVLAAARAGDVAPALVPQLAALAKARASETFLHVAKEAIQMHGGIGMTDEHDIGFYLKRAQAAAVAFGDAAYHRGRWAALNGY